MNSCSLIISSGMQFLCKYKSFLVHEKNKQNVLLLAIISHFKGTKILWWFEIFRKNVNFWDYFLIFGYICLLYWLTYSSKWIYELFIHFKKRNWKKLFILFLKKRKTNLLNFSVSFINVYIDKKLKIHPITCYISRKV